MKTKLLLLLLVLAMTRMIGQNYYKINFAGNPQNVFVQNITQSKSVSLPGTDTLLLKFKGTSVRETDREHQKLTIYPNPMDQTCNFDFENQKQGRVIIQVFNSNGSLLHKYSNKLPQGIQHFQLSGVPSGVFVIDIKTTTGHYSGSFVSTDKSSTAFLLMNKSDSPEKSGENKNGKIPNTTDIENTLLEYRNSVELDFATGDQLKFIAYKTGYENDTLYASPTGDTTITFIFCAKPEQPSDISGNNNPCQGATSLNYSVTNVFGVTYTWSVPTGWTITAGQNTNNITVTAGSASGNITVTPSNTCGTGTACTLAVTTHTVPAQPSAISGIYNPCRGATGISYSVTNVPGVNYSWTLPSGWNITSGDGTNSIIVSVGTTDGNITVIPSNDCGNGTVNSYAVTAQTEALQPSAISGKENPCQGNSEIYSVTNVFGINYIWSVPSDWTITAGQNTNSITVTVGISVGNITVVPSNGCGNGPSRSLAVTTQTGGAGQPSAITGNNNPCQGTTGLIYTVINVAGINYTWTVPSGWTITAGQGTNSITVTAGTEAGNITVTPSNDCGSGPANSFAVTTHTVPAQPSAISGIYNPCQGATGISYSVTNVPGVNYSWTLPSGWNITSGDGTNSIIVSVGTTDGNITVIPSNDCGNGPANSLAVTTHTVPAQPSAITGNTNPCQGATELIYSVTSISGVTYTWTVPSGWSITAGQGSSSITVTAGTTSGNITVTPSNDCGNGPANSFAVSVQLIPAQPSAISGNSAPCEGATGLIYSVTNVPGVTYLWTVPSGWTITAGQNTNNITVSAGIDPGNITVTPSNACGSGQVRTLSVATQTIPEQPSAISGNDDPCQGATGLIYSVTEVYGVIYSWTVPTGWTITSGQNLNSITVTAGSSSGNITVTPSNDCGNGPANSLAVTTHTVPAQPSAITGNANPCQGATGLIYSVTSISGVTYTWTVPSGWTITAGQGTNSITATASTSSGNITVTPSNDCGNGPANSFAVTVQLVPAQPSAISGDIDPCEETTGHIYSVTNVSGVTYTWTVPSGWTITAGQNTNSITVTSGTSSGNIIVTPSNTCGNGTSRTLAVTTHTIPDQPSAITGNNNPCQGATGQTYSVINVSGVTYTWSVPSGWTITAGQNTNSITVSVGTVSGNISVVPSNDCGNGPANSLAVTTHTVPAQPSAITGNANPCQGATGLIYSVTSISGVTYTWTVPSGWTITAGQGTSSITASASTSSGNITVTPSNDCGNGPANSLAVTVQLVPAQPSAITGNNNPCQGATGLTYSVINISGVTYTWSVPSGWSVTAGQGSNSITVTAGTTSGNITVTPSNTCGNGTANSLAVTT